MTFPLATVLLTLSLPSSTDDDEQSYQISEYFAANPRHVLGEWSEREGSRGRLDLSVRWPFVGSVVNGVSSLLHDAAKEIASDVKVKSSTAASLDQSSRAASLDGSIGDFTLGYAAGNVVVQSRSNQSGQPAADSSQPNAEQSARDLYALAKKALACSQDSADRLPLLRQAQTAYAAFKGKWGALRACLGKGGALSSTKLARSREAAFLAALETSRGEPSQLLSYHQLPADSAPKDRQLTLSDALLVCLDERGHVSTDRVGQLLSIAPDEARQQLLLARLAFLSPPGCPSRTNLPQLTTTDCDLVSSHEYLTGDVGSKLVIAKAAAESDPHYSPNVEALSAALPDPLGPEDITVGLGAQWVPVEVYKDWLMSLFPGHKWGLSVERLESSAGWAINCTNPKLSADDSTLRTSRFSGMELLRDAINAKMPVAWVEWKDAEGKSHRVRNEPATMEAQARVAELRSRFDAWVWLGASGGQGADSADSSLDESAHNAAYSDAVKRCKLLCSLYNDKFNGHVPRDFSGDHLTFRGLAATVGHGRLEAAYTPKSRQLRGVAKVLAGGTRDRSAYLVYPPGFGKTDPAILSAVKLTQLGMARRTLIAVPRPVVAQWHARFLTLFPGLADEVLCCDDPVYGIAGYKEVKSARSSGKNPVVSSRSDAGGKVQAEAGKSQRCYSPREAFLASMAAPGWRYLIISHEMLREIPLSQSAFQSLLDEELGELRECLRDTEEVGSKAGSKGARRSLREREAQLQDMQAKHEAKWAELRNRDRAPVSWEDLSIDYLVLDEAHFAKNLGINTKLDSVAGMPRSESQRAYDTYTKIQSVFRSNGRVCALSGTPLTNTLAETYIWQKMLQPKLLRHLSLTHFDSWASVFTEPYACVELNATGQYKTTTRLKFKNIPELISLLNEAWDFVKE